MYAKGEPKKSFTTSDFQLFAQFYGMKENERYAVNTAMPSEAPRYAYSQQAIDDIASQIKQDPEGVIDSLRKRLRTQNANEAPRERPQEQGNSKP